MSQNLDKFKKGAELVSITKQAIKALLKADVQVAIYAIIELNVLTDNMIKMLETQKGNKALINAAKKDFQAKYST